MVGQVPLSLLSGQGPTITIDSTTATKPGTSSAIGIGKKVTVKKGTWNVRKLPSADAAVITRVKGGQVLNVATGWSYVPALGGWISDKGLE